MANITHFDPFGDLARFDLFRVCRYGSKPMQVPGLGVGGEPRHYDHPSRCDNEECRLLR